MFCSLQSSHFNFLRKVKGFLGKIHSVNQLVQETHFVWQVVSQVIMNHIKNRTDNVKLYSLNNISYIKLEDITHNKQLILRNKILVPKAFGTGESQTDLIKPIFAGLNSACTGNIFGYWNFKMKKFVAMSLVIVNTKFFSFYDYIG